VVLDTFMLKPVENISATPRATLAPVHKTHQYAHLPIVNRLLFPGDVELNAIDFHFCSVTSECSVRFC
jgi:hypothetical protein